MMKEYDPNGRRLPIKIDSASNGEHPPIPLTPEEAAANRQAHRDADTFSEKLGQSRRQFLKSTCGAAATLLAFNHVWASFGARGGSFFIPEVAALESEAAEAALGGDEIIIDMQTHCVDPSGDWAKGKDGERWMRVLTEVFGQASQCAYELDCYSAGQLIKEVFLDSDTDVAVISALWGGRGHNPTPTEYADKARSLISAKIGRTRGLIHGGVLPNEPGQLEFMEVQARQYKVDAWKLYPQWGPDGIGFFMDDPRYGIPVLEKAMELNIPVVCAHRGLPLPGLEYQYSKPDDIARVGRMFQQLTFLCYHAGYESGVVEGPFDPRNDKGVDRFIQACLEHDYTPNQGNVYAELGSCWRHYMSKPDQAAHLLGKLLKFLGDERICWGTDALWYGSPQDQIQAFRSFRISPEFQEKYGYPPLTAEAKANILGLNAARIHNLDMKNLRDARITDPVAGLKKEYSRHQNPSYQTYGPKTTEEFVAFRRRSGGFPGAKCSSREKCDGTG